MQYLLLAEDTFHEKLAQLLQTELLRFDVRATFNLQVVKGASFKVPVHSKPDLVIALGTKRMGSSLKAIKKKGIPTCWFYSSVLDFSWNNSIEHLAERIYLDIPRPSTHVSYACLMADFFKNQQEVKTEDDRTIISLVAYDHSLSSTAQKLRNKLSRLHPDIHWKVIIFSEQPEQAIHHVLMSNSLIALDPFGNMCGLLLNCPVVNVYRNRWPFTAPNKSSLINKYLNVNVVPDIASGKVETISQELTKILKNHQHCATILHHYQQMKDEIGREKFSRKVAREIVEWMED